MLNVNIFGTDLAINKDQLISWIIIAFVVYLFCFTRRNPEAGFLEYVRVFGSFFTLCVVSIFLVTGYFIAIAVVKSGQYAGLVVPVGWLFICFVIIKGILAQDFGITIGLNLTGSRFSVDWSKMGPALIEGGLAIAFTFGTFSIFSIVPDTANQPYGPFPLVIAGLIFLFVTVILYILTYKTITGQMKYIRTGSGSFTSLSNEETLPEDANEEEVDNATKKDINARKIFFILWSIFALLFISVFVYCILVDKGIIKM